MYSNSMLLNNVSTFAKKVLIDYKYSHVLEYITVDGNALLWDLCIYFNKDGKIKIHHYHREDRNDGFEEPYHRWDYDQDYYEESVNYKTMCV